jgi:hypothetical protein
MPGRHLNRLIPVLQRQVHKLKVFSRGIGGAVLVADCIEITLKTNQVDHSSISGG